MNVAKYYIYRNLHTGGFSVKLRGRVIHRDNCFFGEGVTFKVNEAGRQRVITDKRKNVHAYSVCDKYSVDFSDKDKKLVDLTKVITYNPYVSARFMCKGKPIEKADAVFFYQGKCYLYE